MAWPLHGLTLTTPDLVLRVMTEADALALGELVPDDVTTDPSHPDLGARVEQTYWRHMATWRPEDWVLPFTVLRDGALLGVQALEGKDFSVRRVVDSYSWLVTGARGQGVGKQMRAAVLELAFRGLGAAYAVSEAYADNAASLGVSRALGYGPNGFGVEKRDDGSGPVRMEHVVLAAADWHPPWPVEIGGLEPCLPLLGL
ncbi:MAG TPA: GNAT family N-acetyltransferase [Mycobacteriales bacterium]|jgi:RimJ/RimL family protein N-acetyltransferase|nr:GNAT family N-acetyltransferase [Mycobacteriales bacterium]